MQDVVQSAFPDPDLTIEHLADGILGREFDGTEIPIDDRGAVIRDENGEILGAVFVFRDITERRRAEAISRLLASIVESSDDAIISKDTRGIITSWNKGAEKIFGYTAGEVVGKPISIIAAPDRVDEMPRILARILHGERIDHYETVRRAKSGKLVNISLTVSPLYDAEGRIVGASKIARDITEAGEHPGGAQSPPGPAPAGTKDGSHRASCRWRGSRLQ